MDNRCLKSLEKILDTNHHIHKHRFVGNFNSYQNWKRSFPNCKFGVSPFLLTEEKYPELRSTLCDIELNDLIIETDAPYIGKNGRGTGCPSMVTDIAWKLSNMFNKPFQEIASTTTANTLQLYHI